MLKMSSNFVAGFVGPNWQARTDGSDSIALLAAGSAGKTRSS